MNRQFQNFNRPDDQMSRASNLSQSQYDRNQGTKSGAQKQAYNPNPFNGRDMVSMSSQMSSMLNTETAMFNPTNVRRENMDDDGGEKKKEIGVLFYSNNCDHSKKFLIDLMKSTVNDLVRKICVESKGVKIPSVIKNVPTLVARGINRPLVGEQVFAWLENENSKSSLDDDIKCFSFNCKDNYTFIEGVDDGTVIDGNTAEWDKDYMINAPLDTTGKEKKGIDEKKMANYKDEMTKMREARNNNQPSAPKNAKIDPDEFNQMFLKQQSKFSKSGSASKFKQTVKNI
jgi:hypothetical protein